MSARDEILGRVRSALADVPSGEGPSAAAPPRTGTATRERTRHELVELFCTRVVEYGATITRTEAGDVARTVDERCRARDASRVVVPSGLPAPWRPDDVEIVLDEALSPAELDACDGALTGCAVAIAETGTIALDGGPCSGRRAVTLVPDLHLCVVEEGQVVAGVTEGIARLEPAAREAGRPITLVSGPSATSDIELSRVEGVHGPRTLEVLVVAA